LKDI